MVSSVGDHPTKQGGVGGVMMMIMMTMKVKLTTVREFIGFQNLRKRY